MLIFLTSMGAPGGLATEGFPLHLLVWAALQRTKKWQAWALLITIAVA